jgi:hypothetical protein
LTDRNVEKYAYALGTIESWSCFQQFLVTPVIFAGKEIRFAENIGITIISVEDPIIFSRKGIRKVFQMSNHEQSYAFVHLSG